MTLIVTLTPMEKTILITGSDTLLGRKLIEKYLTGGDRVIAPVYTKSGELKDSSNKNLKIVPWNRSSIFSAKNLIKAGIQTYGPIEQTILIPGLSGDQTELQDLSTDKVDEFLQTGIHGIVYLVREILRYYTDSPGVLAFTATGNQGKEYSSLDSAVLGSFRELADSILGKQKNLPYLCGFDTDNQDTDNYADYIIQMLETRPEKGMGQWFLFSDKRNFFSGLSGKPRIK